MAKLAKRPVIFALGGAVSAASELGSFVIFKQLHMATFWAALASFCIGFLVSYLLNSRIVFASLQKRSKRQASRQFTMFLALAGVNSLISSSAVSALQQALHSAIIAKICMMIVIAVWNYFILQRVVFKDAATVQLD